MLEFISVKNLGCFDDHNHQINLKGLNVIVGPNNSGKSIIFKFLNLLKQNIHLNNFTKRINGQNIRSSNSERIDSISVSPPNYYFDKYTYFEFEEISYNHNSKEIMLSIGTKYELMKLAIDKDSMTISRNSSKSSVYDFPEYIQKLFGNIHYINTNQSKIGLDTTLGNNNRSDGLAAIESVDSEGSNLAEFLHQRYNDHDERYQEMLKWIKKIDPATSLLKTPIVSNEISMVTHRSDGQNQDMNIKLYLQGDGIQNALVIISAIMFASKGSTIIIDEPETHLHANGIEVLVDLFNHAVNKLGLQIIIMTHSFEIINGYCSDVGKGTPRGNDHEKINPDNFKLITFNNKSDEFKIQEYDIRDKKYTDVRNHLKEILK